MKIKLAICLAVITLAGCAKSSTGRSQLMMMSADELNKMGAASFEEMKTKEKISQSPEINRYVQCVASAITKNVPKSAHDGAWEVVVFDSEQVNAFALPGGKIGVYTGILKVAETQDQLGAIIGHEVGHVIESHSNERLSSNQASQMGLSLVNVLLESQNVESRNTVMAGLGLGMQYGVLMPYGRSHESEADIVGQDLMAKSGFDPKASIKLWQNMAKVSQGAPLEFMSTHPSNATRIKQLTEHLPKSTPFFKQATAPKCVKPSM
ncbi:M48 family peptidase [Colwellia sp. Arc7-635]|jgi:predicted Zn-dependent protease|uniref:M48 family metallopeptidase n=1 Tax=Colwellia sp. Arc7-635 TaxID=2497879 RepID=UPI000F8573BE|nr:M48 family metallopeptidase [Colwellia sp. Arc7-635]AZQ83667.1 M48 family peptidase [Colwellia sp. Arc7-635]